jgi:hypothetical protein
MGTRDKYELLKMEESVKKIGKYKKGEKKNGKIP